jgi:predicted AlkP superfamily pyrophosphatase or phosphodiesterase
MEGLAELGAMILGLEPPTGSRAEFPRELVEEMGRARRLAIIVLDAFGWATWQRWKKQAPFFSSLAERRCVPVRAPFPPKTPVSFATMITGLVPASHGITNRAQPLTKPTLFSVLRNAGKVTAAVGRAKSTVGMLCAPLADRRHRAGSNNDAEVLEIALRLVHTEAPDFMLVQFLDVDNASHAYGPSSRKAAQAVAETDARMRDLVSVAAGSEYASLVLADHGQHDVIENGRTNGTHDGTHEVDFIVPLTWYSPSNPTEVQVCRN